MGKRIVWTDGQDMRIRRLRTEGATWDTIAAQLGLARWTIIERAAWLGVRPPLATTAFLDDVMRPPLPAGHPDSWGAINRGTALEGHPYPMPAVIR